MFAFSGLDAVYWLIGLLVTGGVVTVVIVLVRRAGRSIEDPAQRKMCPHCGELVQEQATKCKHCGEFLDNARDADKRIEPN